MCISPFKQEAIINFQTRFTNSYSHLVQSRKNNRRRTLPNSRQLKSSLERIDSDELKLPITEEKSGLHDDDIEMVNIYQNSEEDNFCVSPCKYTVAAIENGENKNGISIASVASNNQVVSDENSVNYAVIWKKFYLP